MITRPSWFPTALYPFESRTLELNGHRLHYIDEGTGPTLVFFHGNPTWSFLYRDIIQGLRDRFRCIAFDNPGFGLSVPPAGYDDLPSSHADVLTQAIASLELGRFSVMVQDWGGPIGLAVAGRLADQVDGVIIGNTWAWPIQGDKHFERFSGMMGGPIGGFFIRHANAFVNVMIPKGVTRGKVPKEVMAAYRGPMQTPEARRRTHILPRQIVHGAAFLAEVERGLGAIADRPALIVWGDKDIAFRDKERARWEAIFAHHQTVMLPGAGHFIQEDAPDEIVAAIRAWDAARA